LAKEALDCVKYPNEFLKHAFEHGTARCSRISHSKRFEYYRSVKGEAENKEKVGVWLLVSEIVVDVPCYPSCRSNIE
jgi:hypothetical protein